MTDYPQIIARQFQYKAQFEPIRTVISTGGLFPQWFQPPSQPRMRKHVLVYQPSMGPPATQGGSPQFAKTRRHKLSLSLGAGFS